MKPRELIRIRAVIPICIVQTKIKVDFISEGNRSPISIKVIASHTEVICKKRDQQVEHPSFNNHISPRHKIKNNIKKNKLLKFVCPWFTGATFYLHLTQGFVLILNIIQHHMSYPINHFHRKLTLDKRLATTCQVKM